MEKSNIDGREYRLKDYVAIKDPKQQKLYIKHEVYPIDIYVTTDKERNMEVLTMFFNREETKDLYVKWLNHELR